MLRTHTTYKPPSTEGGQRLDSAIRFADRAQRIIEKEATTLETEESAKLLSHLDDLCTSVAVAEGIEETHTVHYIPDEQAFYAFPE